MKRIIKRHRWNLLAAVGAILLLLLYVGPYCWMRQLNSIELNVNGETWRSIRFPDGTPTRVIKLFKPLKFIDSWLTGDRVIVQTERILPDI